MTNLIMKIFQVFFGFVCPIILGWSLMSCNNYSRAGIAWGIFMTIFAMLVPLSCIGKTKE
jgi:hypothetical protein